MKMTESLPMKADLFFFRRFNPIDFVRPKLYAILASLSVIGLNKPTLQWQFNYGINS